MIEIHMAEIGGRWYGLACCGEDLVATAAASTREGVSSAMARLLPRDAEHRFAKDAPAFAEKLLAVLARIEAGDEAEKRFSLSARHVPEDRARLLRVAAAIPAGYVTSYGNVAKAAGTEARVVGQVMASNPLYPIVPCHRVVGTDFSLVGYGGKTNAPALAAKLARLRAEARARERERDVAVEGGRLHVYPVERVLEKQDREAAAASRQRSLFDPPPDG